MKAIQDTPPSIWPWWCSLRCSFVVLLVKHWFSQYNFLQNVLHDYKSTYWKHRKHCYEGNN